MQNDSTPSGSPEDRVTRALPYVVGLLFAFGLLIYNAGWGGQGVAETSAELADTASANAPVAAVRAALSSEEFAGVDVTGVDGTIVLGGSVPDEAARDAAGAAAAAAAGSVTVENRIQVTSLTASAPTVLAAPDSSAPPVTAAASTTVPETTVPETTVPETTVPETTVPETTVPETTVPETTAPQTPAPGPLPTPEELNRRLAELLQAEPIQFELLATRVDARSFGTLDRAAAVILSSPSTRFEVQGHTDSGGQPSFNQRLSDERARAVRDGLIARGVPADRLVATGYGETRPVARNATPEGRSLNRRVEIVVTP